MELSSQNLKNGIKVVIALGIHLFPFRTEKLSPTTPMVLRKSGRVGSRRLKQAKAERGKGVSRKAGSFFRMWLCAIGISTERRTRYADDADRADWNGFFI